MWPAELPSEYAERQLRALVTCMASGDRLPVLSRLAARLGVSRSVVARAARKLAAEGLLITRHGYGTFKA